MILEAEADGVRAASWVAVGSVSDFPKDAGACVKLGGRQIAVFNFGHQRWYAVQNECPHLRQMVLSRGLIGDSCDHPKVACPLHKNTYSLESGEITGGGSEKLQTYVVRTEDAKVYLCIGTV